MSHICHFCAIVMKWKVAMRLQEVIKQFQLLTVSPGFAGMYINSDVQKSETTLTIFWTPLYVYLFVQVSKSGDWRLGRLGEFILDHPCLVIGQAETSGCWWISSYRTADVQLGHTNQVCLTIRSELWGK